MHRVYSYGARTYTMMVMCCILIHTRCAHGVHNTTDLVISGRARDSPCWGLVSTMIHTLMVVVYTYYTTHP